MTGRTPHRLFLHLALLSGLAPAAFAEHNHTAVTPTTDCKPPAICPGTTSDPNTHNHSAAPIPLQVSDPNNVFQQVSGPGSETCTADGCGSEGGLGKNTGTNPIKYNTRIAEIVADVKADLPVIGNVDKTIAPNAGSDNGPSLMTPTVPCKSFGGEMCFPTTQLQKIADTVSGRFQDLAELASNIIPMPSQSQAGDVRKNDVELILSYLSNDQDQIDRVEKATGKPWSELKEDPDRIRGLIRKAPNELKRDIREGWKTINEQHDQIMASSPFHEPLMGARDIFTEKAMAAAGTGSGGEPPMSGGQWAGAQPNNPAANTSAANDALRDGDPNAAAEWARKALKLDPNSSDAHTALAAAEFDLKNYPEAASEAQTALGLNPNDAKAAAVLSLAHGTQLGKVPKASDGAGNGAASAGTPWRPLPAGDAQLAAARDAARKAERALSSGDYAGARAAADRALGIYPHSSYAYGLRSMANLKSGKLDEALNDAVAGLALNPNDKLAQKARAQALLKLGRNSEALLAARVAVAGDPRSGYARFLLAEANAANGDRAGALDALRQAAALDPRYADIYEAALKTAEDGDMAFLFPDIKAGALKSGAAAAGSTRGARFAAVATGALAAGGLLAFVLWKLLGATLVPALKTVFTRRAAAAASPASAAKAPSLLRGQYLTGRQIGVGGMGMVYEGTDQSLGRRVAIKKMRDELRLDRRQRERFVTEARMVAALRHPSIVDIYAIVDESDELCLIFEYVSGQTMYEAIQRRGALPFGEALRLFRGVSAALEYAHKQKIIHRDLKPSNIMVTEDGRVKVMDFGIARAAKDALTRYSMTNTVVGTPPYMAPEQEQGVVRKESDVYALAICFYEAVTGKLPFNGSGGGMLMNKINKAYTPASKVAAGLPEGLDAVFDQAFEPDPDKRLRSVAALQAALEALSVPQAA